MKTTKTYKTVKSSHLDAVFLPVRSVCDHPWRCWDSWTVRCWELSWLLEPHSVVGHARQVCWGNLGKTLFFVRWLYSRMFPSNKPTLGRIWNSEYFRCSRSAPQRHRWGWAPHRRWRSSARFISPWCNCASFRCVWHVKNWRQFLNPSTCNSGTRSFAKESQVHLWGPKMEILTLAHSCSLTNYSTNCILYYVVNVVQWLESLWMWPVQTLNILLSWPKSYNERSRNWTAVVNLWLTHG